MDNFDAMFSGFRIMSILEYEKCKFVRDSSKFDIQNLRDKFIHFSKAIILTIS